ncbi:MAG: 50S ribosomal protein P1 [Candidatus Thorarchaeota archaeon]|nr:50S ribosomal protein P1 [Candidatus Thorarchaeota archaeon]
MEYVYSALLLHKAGKKVDAKGMEAVLTAAGVTPDKGRIKALLAALEGVDIDEALKGAAMPMAMAAAPVAGGAAAAAPAAEEKKKEEEKEEEEEVAGLGSLFG